MSLQITSERFAEAFAKNGSQPSSSVIPERAAAACANPPRNQAALSANELRWRTQERNETKTHTEVKLLC